MLLLNIIPCLIFYNWFNYFLIKLLTKNTVLQVAMAYAFAKLFFIGSIFQIIAVSLFPRAQGNAMICLRSGCFSSIV